MSDELDSWFDKQTRWQKEITKLRNLLLDSGLEESRKWGMPTYTLKKENVAGISSFKNHYGIWFFQGVFLKDKHKLLVNAQEGKTKAMRQMRFDDSNPPDYDLVGKYILEAVENAREGKKVKIVKKSVPMPKQLQNALETNSDLKNAFEALTRGKQNEYKEYIQVAKREETKLKRLDKIRPMILAGIGLNDKYK